MKTRAALALAIAAILSGCASVQSTVNGFHPLPSMGSGETVAIVPADRMQGETLEFRAFAAQLGMYIEADGYHVVPFSLEQPPKYVAFFGYGIDNGTLVTT